MGKNKPAKKRELTEKEKRRTEIIQEKIQSLADRGFTVSELTVPQTQANVRGLLISLVPAALFVLLWLSRNPFTHGVTRGLGKSLLFLAAVLLSFPVHEGIHGLCWGAAAEGRFKSIGFGITRDFYTPYCVCLAPLSRAAYCAGSVMPGVILGAVPCALSVLNGEFYLLAFGCFGLLLAGGDFLISLRLLTRRSSAKSLLCIDHPTEIGLILAEK